MRKVIPVIRGIKEGLHCRMSAALWDFYTGRRKRVWILLWMKLDRIKTPARTSHPDEHGRVKIHITHPVVFWQVYGKGKGWAIRVRELSFFARFKTSLNSLPPLFSPSLAYLLFFLSLGSHLFFSFSRRSLPWSSLLLFIGYSLNHSSLMSFSLTFFICQRVCPPPSSSSSPLFFLPAFNSHPSTPLSPPGLHFKALITRSAATLATHPLTSAPANLISCFY